MKLARGYAPLFSAVFGLPRSVFLLMLFGIILPVTGNHSEEGFRYLALGDSYTVGEGVAIDESFPAQLSDMLERSGVSIESPEIVAKTGWTTGELLNALNINQPSAPFDLVTLLIGVNNQYRGQSVEAYRREFRQLLELATEFAGAEPFRVLVLSIPDWGVTPFAANRDQRKIAREIDRFNRVNHEETLAHGASYLNITPISRAAASDETMLASDGLHPSGKMYHQWARLAVSRIQK